MRRGAVQEEVILLDVLPVIALRSRQSEEPLLEDGETQVSVAVADTEEAVFSPYQAMGALTTMAAIIPHHSRLRMAIASARNSLR